MSAFQAPIEAVPFDEAVAAVASCAAMGDTRSENADWAQSVQVVVAAVAAQWVAPRHDGGRLRPSLGQALLAQRLVSAAGAQAPVLVAHVCAWVMPTETGGPVRPVLHPKACLASYTAWRWPEQDTPTVLAPAGAELTGLGGVGAWSAKAEAMAWRLGTALRQVRWADGVLHTARVTAGLAVFEAWRVLVQTNLGEVRR